MHSVSRWPAGSALLLGGGFIAVACAKAGPGDSELGLATENGSFVAVVDAGGTSEASGSGSSGGTGLNTPPPTNMTGDDSSGGSGGEVPAAGCDPNNCASGCCANGACASGTDDTACGQSGSACTDCTATMQVCSFGSCIMGNGNGSSSSGGSTDPSTGPSPGRTPPMNPLMTASTSCGGKTCTNACFPLGLPCCTSAGACGCIALYFLPCN
jgi:hypothetical protein